MRPATMRAPVAALLLALAGAVPSSAQDVEGRWVLAVSLDAGSGDATFVFEQDGETITGTYEGTFGSHAVVGTLAGDSIAFSFEVEQLGRVTFTGTVDGDTMTGTCSYGALGDGSFSGRKSEGLRSRRPGARTRRSS